MTKVKKVSKGVGKNSEKSSKMMMKKSEADKMKGSMKKSGMIMGKMDGSHRRKGGKK